MDPHLKESAALIVLAMKTFNKKQTYFELPVREVLNFSPAHDGRVPANQACAELLMSWKRL